MTKKLTPEEKRTSEIYKLMEEKSEFGEGVYRGITSALGINPEASLTEPEAKQLLIEAYKIAMRVARQEIISERKYSKEEIISRVNTGLQELLRQKTNNVRLQ